MQNKPSVVLVIAIASFDAFYPRCRLKVKRSHLIPVLPLKGNNSRLHGKKPVMEKLHAVPVVSNTHKPTVTDTLKRL